jgi:hypothetical protein
VSQPAVVNVLGFGRVSTRKPLPGMPVRHLLAADARAAQGSKGAPSSKAEQAALVLQEGGVQVFASDEYDAYTDGAQPGSNLEWLWREEDDGRGQRCKGKCMGECLARHAGGCLAPAAAVRWRFVVTQS